MSTAVEYFDKGNESLSFYFFCLLFLTHKKKQLPDYIKSVLTLLFQKAISWVVFENETEGVRPRNPSGIVGPKWDPGIQVGL